MPFEGEKLDELLSGYLDNQLSKAELSEVELALRSEASVRRRLEELRQTGVELRQLRDVPAATNLPLDFSARVLTEARRRAAAAKLPLSHYIRCEETVSVPSRSNYGSPTRVVLVVAALAAAVLLSIYLPRWFSDVKQAPRPDFVNVPPVEVETPLIPEVAPEPAAVQYVGDSNFQILYTLVVDMKISQEAFDNDYVPGVFSASGVKLQAPIVANDELKEALSDARMTVKPDSDTADKALIYFVHADTASVGQVVETFFNDLTNVPELRFDMAFDTPVNRLMKRIAESSGKRFAVDDSIAAPVAENPFSQASPFTGISPQGHLVSSNQRIESQGANGAPGLGLAGEGMSTFLLLIRLPK